MTGRAGDGEAGDRPVLHGFHLPGVLTTRLEELLRWSRASSLWYLLFGLACCAIELMATGASRYDFDRFGMIFRASPRQSDLMIVAGTVTAKMAPVIKHLYHQMAEPRWVIAMGACATNGGPYHQGYNVVDGVNKLIPVDVYTVGCPPRPETLLYGVLKLQEKIRELGTDGARAALRREQQAARDQLAAEGVLRGRPERHVHLLTDEGAESRGRG